MAAFQRINDQDCLLDMQITNQSQENLNGFIMKLNSNFLGLALT